MAEISPQTLADIDADLSHALLSTEQMGRADAAAIAQGIPGLVLMENAGRAVADLIVNRYPVRRVAVMCGPGNNGGDGYVVARLLKARGWPVDVVALVPPSSLSGDAAQAAARWNGPVAGPSPQALTEAELAVDGLFGAGLSRPIEGAAAELIAEIARRRLACVAIDMPSGVHGDSGLVMGSAPDCAYTVSFFRAKPGHYLLPGRQKCGDTLIADIGIPATAIIRESVTLWRNDPSLWRRAVPRARLDDHKYRRGHALIVGGTEMTGAARLAALAARRIGAGMLSLAAEAQACPIYRTAEPGNIVVACADGAAIAALARERRVSALLVGPGAGAVPRTREIVQALLKLKLPAVLDADALSVFADKPADLFGAIGGPVLMTPHDGEFARLFPDLADEPNKLVRARTAAQRSGAVVLLKGADTVIAAPDGRAIVNTQAPAWLATAGAGDVLAGIAVGLMAQGLGPLAAGAAASWLHGQAGVLAGRGLIAEDLPKLAGQALAALL